MRELKFRAWSPYKEMMSYDVTLYANGWITCVHDDGDESKYRFQNVIPLMQYTGVKDKQAKEIYEGDIVKGKRFGNDKEYHRHIGSVEWYAQRYIVNGVAKYKGWNNEELNGSYEVIGNIYANPELLAIKEDN